MAENKEEARRLEPEWAKAAAELQSFIDNQQAKSANTPPQDAETRQKLGDQIKEFQAARRVLADFPWTMAEED